MLNKYKETKKVYTTGWICWDCIAGHEKKLCDSYAKLWSEARKNFIFVKCNCYCNENKYKRAIRINNIYETSEI